MDEFVSELPRFVVVHHWSGATVCCLDHKSLVQGGDVHLKVQTFSVQHVHWEVFPRVLGLVVIVLECASTVEVQLDFKSAVPEDRKEALYKRN